MLQAYIDESYSIQSDIFVFGGFISPTEKWLAFSRAWAEILPHAGLTKDGQPYFKMSELALRDGGIERSQAFYRVIEKHCELAVSVMLMKRDLDAAVDRLLVPNFWIDWGLFRNPYHVAYRALMDHLHNNWASEAMQTVVSASGPIEFIFDDMLTEKRPILDTWNEYVSSRSDDRRKLYGTAPFFKNDLEHLPLQAADFWVWWRRKWYEGSATLYTFGEWEKTKGKPAFALEITYSEDQLVETFTKLLREQVGPVTTIFDRKTSQPL